MAQLNFPDPNDTQEFEAAGILWTWNSTLGVWSSETTTAFDAGELYLSKRNDDAADGNIDFRGLTTHQQGVQLPNLTNAGALATDVDGNIIAGTGSGGDGHDNQDLGYVSNGNNAGQVTITDGTPADIPIATNSVAGLFTGTEKQKLAGVANGATNTANQNLGYTKNGDSAGTVTITNGTNATVPIVSNSTAGLMTGAQKKVLDGLRTNSQNDARYLRIDSGAPHQVRQSGNVTFKGKILCKPGSTSAPGITFDGDSDTGFYWKQSGQIAITGDNALCGMLRPFDTAFWCGTNTKNQSSIIARHQTGNGPNDYYFIGQRSTNNAQSSGNTTYTINLNGGASFSSWLYTSDQTYKTNILDAPSQWDTVKALRLVNFSWLDHSPMGRDSSTGTEVGLLAQQVETIAPEAVETVKLPDEVPEFKSIKIEKVFFKMLGALQESQQRIEDLEARLASLER